MKLPLDECPIFFTFNNISQSIRKGCKIKSIDGLLNASDEEIVNHNWIHSNKGVVAHG